MILFAFFPYRFLTISLPFSEMCLFDLNINNMHKNILITSE